MSDRLRGLPTLPRIKGEQRAPRLPGVNPVVYGLGPESAGLRKRVRRTGGPGDPPPGFVGATTSLSEWLIYWAFARIFNDPEDPRQPNEGGNYYGGKDWNYQEATGAFTRQLGSAVIDFLFYANRQRLAIRVQTQRFHEQAGSEKQGLDILQVIQLESQGYTVQDIFESDFIKDDNGQAAIVVVKEALGMIQRVSTITSGRSTARA